MVSPRRSPASRSSIIHIPAGLGGKSHRPGTKDMDRLTQTGTALPLFRAGSNRWIRATRSAAWSTVSFSELTPTLASSTSPSVSTSNSTTVVSATACSIKPVVRYSCLRACPISAWLTITGPLEPLVAPPEAQPAARTHPTVTSAESRELPETLRCILHITKCNVLFTLQADRVKRLCGISPLAPGGLSTGMQGLFTVPRDSRRGGFVPRGPPPILRFPADLVTLCFQSFSVPSTPESPTGRHLT